MASKSKMSAARHIVNCFFNGLACSADHHMLSGVFGVEEFIFNISFMIRPRYGLQIKDGRRPPYCKLVFQWLVQTIAHPPQSHESPDPKMTHLMKCAYTPTCLFIMSATVVVDYMLT